MWSCSTLSRSPTWYSYIYTKDKSARRLRYRKTGHAQDLCSNRWNGAMLPFSPFRGSCPPSIAEEGKQSTQKWTKIEVNKNMFQVPTPVVMHFINLCLGHSIAVPGEIVLPCFARFHIPVVTKSIQWCHVVSQWLLNSAPRKMDASSNLLNVASSTASSAVTGQNWPPDEVVTKWPQVAG